jgi:hypothetical protein
LFLTTQMHKERAVAEKAFLYKSIPFTKGAMERIRIKVY